MTYENQFAALSHPLRQQILDALQVQTASVRELTDQMEVSQPVVSQHLKVLRDAGLISATPDGMKRIYKIEAERLEELRQFLSQHWLTSLQNIEADDD